MFFSIVVSLFLLTGFYSHFTKHDQCGYLRKVYIFELQGE